jgi:pyruvate,water dikinase
LKRHGHRCIKEAELRQVDWGTDPTPLVRLLQSTTRAQLPRGKDGKAGKGGKGAKGGKRGDTAAASGGNLQGRGKPGSKLKAYLASHPHLGCCARRLLVWAIKRARSGVHRREMGKSLQVEAHSIVKRAFRALGRALALEGTLPDFDLVYFLTYDELGRVCRMRGTGTPLTEGLTRTLVKSALQRRRLLPRQEAMHFDDLGQVSRRRIPSFLG